MPFKFHAFLKWALIALSFFYLSLPASAMLGDTDEAAPEKGTVVLAKKDEEPSGGAAADFQSPLVEPSSAVLEEKKGTNKESVRLLRENFSEGVEVDFKGLYTFLGYTFSNQQLLVDALSPLLPKPLQGAKKKFEHLEFLGDSVLGVLIREHILLLFPEGTRRMHNDLYEQLVGNKTLTEVYQAKLIRLEKYLPYPDSTECKYCNVVEAIIGAIYTDEGKKLTNSRKFVFKILDAHILQEKWRALGSKKDAPTVLPCIRDALEQLLRIYGGRSAHPKTFLLELLSKTHQDQPRYTCSIGKTESGQPVYSVRVSGTLIGERIVGSGITQQAAEENAAVAVINFLAQQQVFEQQPLDSKTYSQFVEEYCYSQGITINFSNLTDDRKSWKYSAKLRGVVIAEGIAFKKAEAKEKAAKDTYLYLVEHDYALDKAETDKPYTMLLKELEDQQKLTNFQLVDEGEISPVSPILKFRIQIGKDFSEDIEGVSKDEIREEAFRRAFEYLLENQKTLVP